jgi:MinD-like ATPase involved in chromosome partitioning or flagellar assembly
MNFVEDTTIYFRLTGLCNSCCSGKLFKLHLIFLSMGKSIGIVGLKGGVGKTSTVTSLGDALAGFGQKVLLVDANFSAPNLGIHLNIIDPEKTIKDVLDRTSNFSDAIYVVADNLHVLPGHLFQRKKINPLILKNRLGTVKGKYDVVLIDSSPALNEETLAAMLASDELFAVTTPDYSTLSTTIKAIKAADIRGTPITGLILNKVHHKNFELDIHDIEDTAGVPVMAVIPHDLNILKAQSRFIPSTTQKPYSKASQEYKKLAATLIGQKYKPFSFSEVIRGFTPKRHEINREIYYTRVFGEK